MNIKTIITATQVLTVLLSLVVVMLMGGALIDSSKNQYYAPDNIRLDRNAAIIGGVLALELSPQDLSGVLDTYGYKLCILDKNTVIYSDADPFQQRLIFMTDPAGWDPGQIEYILMDGYTIVGLKGSHYIYAAVNQMHRSDWMAGEETQFEGLRTKYLLFGGISIVLILMFSYLISTRLVKRILRPVDALADGARRVAEGDLSQPVDYGGWNELVPVVDAFNEMQVRLRQEREKTAAYEKSRTDLIAGISHDLRTPLTSVKGYIKGLQDGVANTPEKQEHYLSVAYHKACDMDFLLQKLFDFSRLETGKLLLDPRPGDLGDFVQRFQAESAEDLAQSGITLTAVCQPGPHPVSIDVGQMNRVLANLIENTLKHAGVRPLSVVLRVWRDASGEHMSFSDNGVGAPEPALPFLFDEFWRGDESRSRKHGEGSGLGLYIVKYIAVGHGGTVTARNENGLTIELTLPGEELKNNV